MCNGPSYLTLLSDDMATTSELYSLFDTMTPTSTLDQMSKGVTSILYKFTDADKTDDWRSDGYRWRQNDSKTLKLAGNTMKKIFFQVC